MPNAFDEFDNSSGAGTTAPVANAFDEFDAKPAGNAFDEFDDRPGEITGTVNEFRRGLLGGQQQLLAAQRATAPKGPTLMQTRRAFVKAMSDPRYMDAIIAAGDDTAKQREADQLLGPAAEVNRLRTLYKANRDILDAQISELEEQQQAIPQSAAMAEWGQADNSNWYKVLAKNPVEITAGIMAQSLPAMAPAMAGNMAVPGGRVTKAIATGAGSFGTEAANSYLDAARNTGYDFTDPDKVREFFDNPEAQAQAKEFAVKRGLPIAVFDALTAGFAGKFMEPALKEGAKKVLVATGKEVALQAAVGAAGEAAAQATSGQKLSAKDIVGEALGEIASGPQEVISNLRESRAAQAEGGASAGGAATVPASRPLDDELPSLPDSGNQRAELPPGGVDLPVTPPPSEPMPGTASPADNSPAAPAPTVPTGTPASPPHNPNLPEDLKLLGAVMEDEQRRIAGEEIARERAAKRAAELARTAPITPPPAPATPLPTTTVTAPPETGAASPEAVPAPNVVSAPKIADSGLNADRLAQPSRRTEAVPVTDRHLADARSLLSGDQGPTVVDDIEGGVTTGKILFPAADFSNTLDNLREQLAQQMFAKPWDKLRKDQRAKVDSAHKLSTTEGMPADEVLRGIAGNEKYADWSVDDLAEALTSAASVKPKEYTRAERELAQRIAEAETAPAETEVTDFEQAAASVAADPVEAFLTRLVDATTPEQRTTPSLYEGLSSGPAWLTERAVNGALRAVRAVYRATKNLPQAVQAGLDWLRQQNLAGYNEAEAKDWLTRNVTTTPADDDINYREFQDQMDQSAPLAPETAAQVTNLLYQRRENETDAAFAARIIAAVGGPQAAMEVFTDGANGLPGAVRMFLGQLILKQLGHAGQHEAAARFYDEQFAAHVTDTAQSLQSLAAFLSLTPEGKVIWAKRKLERAAQDQLAPVTPDLNAAKGAMDQANAAGIEAATAAPDVQASARNAVDEALTNQANTLGTELRAAIIQETLDQLRQAGLLTEREAEITKLHLEAPGGTTLEQKFQSAGITDPKKRAEAIMDGYKKRAAVEKAKIKRLAAENRKGRKERIGDWVRKVRSIPEREREAAARSLLKAMEPGPNTPRPALEEFHRRLTATLKTLLPAKTKTKAAPLTDVQRLREMLANPESFAGVWEQLGVEIRAKYGAEGAAQLEALGGLSPNRLIKQAMGSRVEGAIATAMRDLQVKLANVIKQHHTRQDATGRTLAQKISAAIGLDAATAARVELAVQSRFRSLVADKKRQALDRLLKPVVRRRLAKPDLAQRIIEASNLGALSEEQFWNAVRPGLDLPKWTDELAKSVRSQAEAIARIPDDQLERQQKAQMEMLNTIERAKGLDGLDLGLAFYLTNILTGITTHAKNVLSTGMNASTTLAVEGARAIASGHPSDLLLVWTALGEGFKQGGRAAADVMRTGMVTGSRLQKLEPGRALELTRFGHAGGVPTQNRVTRAVLENRLARFLNAWKYNYRLMAAEDLLFFKPAEEAKSALLAKRIARSEGLRGEAAQDRARTILGYGRPAIDAAETQVIREGLTGSAAKRRVAEILAGQRPEQLREDARQFALRITFNNDPYGALGFVAGLLNQAKASPDPKIRVAANLITPFTNIVSNVVNESLNFTPVGLLRSEFARTQLLGRKLESLSLDERKDLQAELRAKALLGTGLLAALALKAASGLDDKDPEFAIYASGPGADADRRGWQAAGGIAHSIKLGNRYYSYALTPMALPLAWLGNIMDRQRDARIYKQRGAQRLAENLPLQAANALLGMPKVITEQSFLSGLTDLAQMVSEPNAEVASRTGLKRVVQTASGFAVPNAVRQIDRFFDPQVYEQRDLNGMLANAIPFVRGQAGRPALNALGLPVVNPLQSAFTSKQQGTAVMRFLAETGNWPTLPNRNEIYPRAGRTMTDEEFYQYVRSSGQAAMEKLGEFKSRGRLEYRAVNGQPKALTTEQQAEIIADVIATERARVRHRMGF